MTATKPFVDVETLRELRRRRKKSLRALADEAGLTRRQLTRIMAQEGSRVNVLDSTLMGFARALSVDPSMLSGDKPTPRALLAARIRRCRDALRRERAALAADLAEAIDERDQLRDNVVDQVRTIDKLTRTIDQHRTAAAKAAEQQRQAEEAATKSRAAANAVQRERDEAPGARGPFVARPRGRELRGWVGAAASVTAIAVCAVLLAVLLIDRRDGVDVNAPVAVDVNAPVAYAERAAESDEMSSRHSIELEHAPVLWQTASRGAMKKYRLLAVSLGVLEPTSMLETVEARGVGWDCFRGIDFDIVLDTDFCRDVYAVLIVGGADGEAVLDRLRMFGVSSVTELDGASVCIQTDTTTELNLADYFHSNGMMYEAVTIETNDEARQNYLARRCDVYTTEASGLAAPRSAFELES